MQPLSCPAHPGMENVVENMLLPHILLVSDAVCVSRPRDRKCNRARANTACRGETWHFPLHHWYFTHLLFLVLKPAEIVEETSISIGFSRAAVSLKQNLRETPSIITTRSGLHAEQSASGRPNAALAQRCWLHSLSVVAGQAVRPVKPAAPKLRTRIHKHRFNRLDDHRCNRIERARSIGSITNSPAEPIEISAGRAAPREGLIDRATAPVGWRAPPRSLMLQQRRLADAAYGAVSPRSDPIGDDVLTSRADTRASCSSHAPRMHSVCARPAACSTVGALPAAARCDSARGRGRTTRALISGKRQPVPSTGSALSRSAVSRRYPPGAHHARSLRVLDALSHGFEKGSYG